MDCQLCYIYNRYNDDGMSRHSMSRYNHGDRMNSFSQYNFGHNENRGRRHYNDRNAEEPEWFSGGPTSQNDTIELRGFEEYTERQDSPTSRNSGDADDDKTSPDYESDTDKANEDSEKANDSNNNDKSGNDEPNNHETNTEDTNNFEQEGTGEASAESKSNRKDDNFNIEDFLKMENLTDLLSVSGRIAMNLYIYFHASVPY